MSTLLVVKRNGQLVAHIESAHLLHETQIQQASEELLDLCRQAADKGMSVVIDFEGVQFISSAMIGKLMNLRQDAEQMEVTLHFQNLCSEIQEVLKIMRLHNAFQLGN